MRRLGAVVLLFGALLVGTTPAAEPIISRLPPVPVVYASICQK